MSSFEEKKTTMEERIKKGLFIAGIFLLGYLCYVLQQASFENLNAFIRSIKRTFPELCFAACFITAILMSELWLDKNWQIKFNKFAKKNGLDYQSKPDDHSAKILTAFGVDDMNGISNVFIGTWDSIPLAVFHARGFGGFCSGHTYADLGIYALVDLQKVAMQTGSKLTAEEISFLEKEKRSGGIDLKNGKIIIYRKRVFTGSYFTIKKIAAFMEEVAKLAELLKKSEASV